MYVDQIIVEVRRDIAVLKYHLLRDNRIVRINKYTFFYNIKEKNSSGLKKYLLYIYMYKTLMN